MKYFIIHLTLILGFLGVMDASAQEFVITGTVQDEERQPLPFASVALFSTHDSVPVGGSTTDVAGGFALTASPGNYFLKISFLSYQEKIIRDVQVNKQAVTLGNITLVASAQSLEEVVVQGEKSTIQLQLDKRVFNVGQDLSSKGGNAAEILDNIPSVSVDVEGNVSLRGSQNVRILIDGKPSGLTGISSADALRQLQAHMIESVEIITNPSARYDAEGEVGIINIVLKKEKAAGTNGSFEVAAGYPQNFSGSFSINHRKKWVNLFAGNGVSFRKNPGSGFTRQVFEQEDTTFSYERDRDHSRGGWSNNFRAGTDFFLNDKNSITLSGRYRYSKNKNDVDLVFRDFNGGGELQQVVTRTEDELETSHDFEAALNYRKTFAQKGREWKVDVKWMQNEDTETADLFEQDNLGSQPIIQRSGNTEDELNWLFQTDYIHPLGKEGKVEGGLKGTLRTIDSDFTVEEQVASDSWITLADFDNHFRYVENIYAAYLMAGNKSGKVSYQGGLRAEYSDITTELKRTDIHNRRKYLDLFPSAHLAYQITEGNTIQLGYTRRLSRPHFRNLLPFQSFSDNRSFFGGNPELQPEYTHSLELGYLRHWQKGSLLASLYYRHRTGVIERIVLVDSANITRLFPINLSDQNAYGLEFNLNHDLLKWWRLSGSFNFYRAITDGNYEGQSFHSDTYSWNTRLSSKMTLFKKLDFQATFFYNAPRETAQGKNKSMYALDAGLSMDVIKGNGTLTLSGRDLFNTRKWRGATFGDGFYSEYEFQWHSRQVMLTFSYRLNQKKKRAEQRGGEGGFEGGEDMGF